MSCSQSANIEQEFDADVNSHQVTGKINRTKKAPCRKLAANFVALSDVGLSQLPTLRARPSRRATAANKPPPLFASTCDIFATMVYAVIYLQQWSTQSVKPYHQLQQ